MSPTLLFWNFIAASLAIRSTNPTVSGFAQGVQIGSAAMLAIEASNGASDTVTFAEVERGAVTTSVPSEDRKTLLARLQDERKELEDSRSVLNDLKPIIEKNETKVTDEIPDDYQDQKAAPLDFDEVVEEDDSAFEGEDDTEVPPDDDGETFQEINSRKQREKYVPLRGHKIVAV